MEGRCEVMTQDLLPKPSKAPKHGGRALFYTGTAFTLWLSIKLRSWQYIHDAELQAAVTTAALALGGWLIREVSFWLGIVGRMYEAFKARFGRAKE